MPSQSIAHTRWLAALVAVTWNVFLARSLRSRNSDLWSRHHWSMSLHTLIPQALCSIEFLAHVIFTCTASKFNYLQKEFNIPRPTWPAPENAGTRNGYLPAQDFDMDHASEANTHLRRIKSTTTVQTTGPSFLWDIRLKLFLHWSRIFTLYDQ